MSVCLSGYAFRHALKYRAESWHWGRGRAHEVCGHIFEVAPAWGQRSSRGQPALNAIWLPNLVGRTLTRA